MAKITVNGVVDLRARAGTELGKSEWQTMEMSRIRKFADATDDHQWIHVDEERANRESPYGKPIAHGYLSLSLTAGAFFDCIEFKNFHMVVNYGTNKVRSRRQCASEIDTEWPSSSAMWSRKRRLV